MMPPSRALLFGLYASGAALGCSDASATAPCSSELARQGISYDIQKSRFAFGGTPTMMTLSSHAVRWQGPNGSLLIQTYDAAPEIFAQLLPYAPQASLPAATTDIPTAEAYLRDYIETMGVPACQIIGVPGSHDPIVQRVIVGIGVPDSTAMATFDVDYQTTSENLYWPEIPEDAVAAAQAFQSALASPSALAAFKSKLPSDAQGRGHVVIHHSSPAGVLEGPFAAVVTYDVRSPHGTELYSFDSNANLVTLPM
jgi:hypothetical protein